MTANKSFYSFEKTECVGKKLKNIAPNGLQLYLVADLEAQNLNYDTKIIRITTLD